MFLAMISISPVSMLGFFVPSGSLVDQTFDLQHPLEADTGNKVERFFGQVWIDGDLDDARAVTQVEERPPRRDRGDG